MEAVFSVGDKFKSFDELQAKVHRYEELEFVKLWIRDSRAVTAAKKRVTRYLCSRSSTTKLHTLVYMAAKSSNLAATESVRHRRFY